MKTISIQFLKHGNAAHPMTNGALQELGRNYNEFRNHPRVRTSGFEIAVTITGDPNEPTFADVFYQAHREDNSGSSVISVIQALIQHSLLGKDTTFSIQGMPPAESLAWINPPTAA